MKALALKLRHSLQGTSQRLLPYLRKTAGYWRGLTVRERRQLILMSFILLGAVAWLLFTRPALKTLSHWQQELPRLRSQQAALQTVLAEAGGGQLTRQAHGTPQARLAQSLRAAGLDYQLRSAGPNLILSVQNVEAQRLVNWLLTAPATLGMQIEQAQIARINAGESTRVNASVMLAEQQQGKGE